MLDVTQMCRPSSCMPWSLGVHNPRKMSKNCKTPKIRNHWFRRKLHSLHGITLDRANTTNVRCCVQHPNVILQSKREMPPTGIEPVIFASRGHEVEVDFHQWYTSATRYWHVIRQRSYCRTRQTHPLRHRGFCCFESSEDGRRWTPESEGFSHRNIYIHSVKIQSRCA